MDLSFSGGFLTGCFMLLIRKLLFVLFALLFVACSKEEPIQIPEEKSEFFGVWIYKDDAYGNNVRKDNMLLAFYQDSTVSYKRCIKRMNGHKNTVVPDARIIKLTDKELVINVKFLLSINLDFDIQTLPYQENNDWFMKVDGVLLRKLKPGEKSDHDLWECGDEAKQDTTKEEGIKF
jgi:hypothetical protein